MKNLTIMVMLVCSFFCGSEFAKRKQIRLYDTGWQDGYQRCKADIDIMLRSPDQNVYKQQLDSIEFFNVGM